MSSKNHMPSELLSDEDLRTAGPRRTTVVRPAPSKKLDINGGLRRLARWIDNKILPTVFLAVLAGFAVKGAQQFLPEMNETTQVVACIAFVAVLVVRVVAGDKDKV